MNIIRTTMTAATVVAALALSVPPSAQAQSPPATTIASGVDGASGSTIGPDGALYVTESQTGQILRIDPVSGERSVFATGLPVAIAPIGGPMDIEFDGDTAYVLVSLVGEFFGSTDPSGIYRMDGPDQWTVIADLGQWAIDNPPTDGLEFEITTGVHYAMASFRDGFVVSEAHHNKLVHVTTAGEITLLEEYGNTVPSGLAIDGDRVLVAMSGPTPHLPEDGQIIAHDAAAGSSTRVAAGGPLLVDVEVGDDGAVYGLAQGFFTPGQDAGAPADPGTGELMVVDGDTLETVASGLDRPTSVEIVGEDAFIVQMTGDVVRLDGIRSSSTGDPAEAELPATGSETLVLALLAAVLIAVGGFAVVTTRRPD